MIRRERQSWNIQIFPRQKCVMLDIEIRKNPHHKRSHDFASGRQNSSKGKAETPENMTVSAWHSAMTSELAQILQTVCPDFTGFLQAN